MFNINAEVLRDQAKSISNSPFYLKVVLDNEATEPKLLQRITKTVHTVNGWEFEELAKAKWYSKVFTKPIQQFTATLDVYENGLVYYALYNTSGKKETCTARTIGNIFQIAVHNCYVLKDNKNLEQYNGVLVSILVGLNKKKKEKKNDETKAV